MGTVTATVETVSSRPRTLIPMIIRPVDVRPAVGSSALPTAAPPQIIRLPMDASLNVDHPTEQQQQASRIAVLQSAPAPDMSAPTAVQRVRRIVEQSKERAKQSKEEQENECVICLDRPMNTVLRPCGHVQMCLECCQEHMAIAESKGVEPQVMSGWAL